MTLVGPCSRGVTRRGFGSLCGSACVGAALMSGCSTDEGVLETATERLSFDDLKGWRNDDHGAACTVFQSTKHLARPSPIGPVFPEDWANLPLPDQFPDARCYFEAQFTPVLIGAAPALFTAYYEPELEGARTRGGRYQHPIYARPPDLVAETPYVARAAISSGALAGKGLEIFWLADQVEAFFLEIQGSGRIRLPDGAAVRVGYAAKNGRPYRAIGKVLVDRGEITLAEASAQSIKAWLRAHPDQVVDVLNENASYVFFTERSEIAADAGPIGAMGASVTAGRSIAVDPAFHPLGAPIWLEAQASAGALMIAQDIGGAIKGAQRADLFLGSGDVAGDAAGPYRRSGRMITLLPNSAAARLTVS
jgi:membrane-bound lytic murein transglycosylase A